MNSKEESMAMLAKCVVTQTWGGGGGVWGSLFVVRRMPSVSVFAKDRG